MSSHSRQREMSGSVATRRKFFAASIAIAALLLCLQAPRTASASDPGPPEIQTRQSISDKTVNVNQSVTLELSMSLLSGNHGRGGITASIPKFDRSNAGHSDFFYDSADGSVVTESYTNGSSKVSYFDRGYSPIYKANGTTGTAKHLLVEVDDSDWPVNRYRTLELEITFKKPGSYRIYYRYWLCADGYEDCTRAPSGGRVDQQGWSVGSFTVTVKNSAPVVEIVSPLYTPHLRPGDRQTFKVRAEDPDSNLSSWEWSVNSTLQNEESFSLTEEDSRTIGYTFENEGEYGIEVVYRDSDGASDSVSWDVLVEPPQPSNRPPDVSKVSPLQSLQLRPGDSQKFEVRATDSDGDLSSFKWLVNDQTQNGMSFPLTDDDTRDFSYEFLTEGRYEIKAIYSDSAGESDSVSWTIPVEPPQPSNRPPDVSKVSPLQSLQLRPGDSQKFEVRATDSDGDLSSFEWLVNGQAQNGVSFPLTDDDTRDFSYEFLTEGRYEIKAIYSDSAGESDSVSWIIPVEPPLPPNLGPILTMVSPSQSLTLKQGTTQTFKVSALDHGGDLISREWRINGTFLDGMTFNPKRTDSMMLTHTFSTAGSYRIEAFYRDADRTEVSIYWTVAVVKPPPSNRPPSAKKVSPLQSLQLRPGDSQTFEVRATDRDANLSSWEWSVNGAMQNGESFSLTEEDSRTISYTFSTKGTHEIEIIYRDSDGASDSVSWDVLVEPPAAPPVNRPPDVEIISPLFTPHLRPGDRQAFEVRAIDKDADLSSWEWRVDGAMQNGMSFPLTGEDLRKFHFTFWAEGAHEVEAIFYDAAGDSKGVSWDVLVESPAPPPVNRPPSVEIVSPRDVPHLEPGDTQTFNVRGDDRDGNLTAWKVQLDGETLAGESFSPTGSASKTLTRTFPDAGEYNLVFIFTDSDGAYASKSVDVFVDDQEVTEPLALESTDPESPLFIYPGQRLIFAANASVGDGKITSVEWLIDGTPLNAASYDQKSIKTQFVHEFTDVDLYEVKAVFSSLEDVAVEALWYVHVLERATEISPNSAIREEVSNSGHEDFYNVFVKKGLPFRAWLEGQDGARFSFQVRRKAPSGTWTAWIGPSSFHKYQSYKYLGEHLPFPALQEDSWFELKVTPEGNQGAYTLRTSATAAFLEIVLAERKNSSGVDDFYNADGKPAVDVLATCVFNGAGTGFVPFRKVIDDSKLHVYYDVTPYTDAHPCALDEQVLFVHPWIIDPGYQLFGRQILEVSLHMIDERGSLNEGSEPFKWKAAEVQDGRIIFSDLIYIIREEPEFHVDELVYGLIDFLVGDDIAVLQSKEAALWRKGLALGFIAMNFLPGGAGAKNSAKIYIKGGKWTDEAAKGVSRTKLADRADEARNLNPDLARQLDSSSARAAIEKKYRKLKKVISEIEGPLYKTQNTAYSVAKFEENLDLINSAGKKTNGLVTPDDVNRLFGELLKVSKGSTGAVSNVFQAGHLIRKGHRIGMEVKVYGGKSVDVVIYTSSDRQWHNAIAQEVKQVNPNTKLNANKLKDMIEEASSQLRAAAKTAEEYGASIRTHVVIDARFMNFENAGKIISKRKVERFLGGPKGDGYWVNVGDDIDYISILTPNGPMDFQRPVAAPLARWDSYRPAAALTAGSTPQPTPTSAATPEPTPVPTLQSAPTPLPTPESTPVSTPESTPTPAQTPGPTPVPTPEFTPTPAPTPGPTPVPTPESTPTPAPTPGPTPVPTLESTSTPLATPEPTPVPTPQSTPTPQPTPGPTPVPTPQASPEETPNPIPEATSIPTPQTSPTPASAPTPKPTTEPSPDPTPGSTPTPISDPPSDCSSVVAATYPVINPGLVSDCEALIASRAALAGGGVSLNWTSNVPIESWDGVTLGGSPIRVVRLILQGHGLSGGIPSEMGSLSGLEVLDLWGNELSGEIPSELGSLSSLELLQLGNNQLSGQIPPELSSLSRLEILSLEYNQLECEIPSELGRLPRLEVLRLEGNQLGGEIPSELGNLPNLQHLSVDYNQLSGGMPSEFGSLFKLEELHLEGNRLSGDIPSELGNLPNLKRISLDHNQLSGRIPSDLGSLSKLEKLSLEGNRLSGEIPSGLGDLANLQRLSLGHNLLSDGIPSDLGSLTKLEELRLAGNRLSGEIPSGLGNLPNLHYLSLDFNQLSGRIPSELGKLSKLGVMFLAGNLLTGCVPRELMDVTHNDFAELGLPLCSN